MSGARETFDTTWDILAATVLADLAKGGTRRMLLELVGEPDDRGHVRVRIVPAPAEDRQAELERKRNL